jgi:hypothetical protein
LAKPATATHYERLAGSYDLNWSHSAAFLDWMAGEMIATLALAARDPTVPRARGLFCAGDGALRARDARTRWERLPRGRQRVAEFGDLGDVRPPAGEFPVKSAHAT